MLKHMKALKMLVANLAVAGMGFYAIVVGGDPTLIGFMAIAALTLLNGIDINEWLSAKRAMEEMGDEEGHPPEHD